MGHLDISGNVVSYNGDVIGRFLHHLFRHWSNCCSIVSLFAAPFWLQVVVFAVFSVLSIFYLRPSLVALLNHDADRRVSNADAIIGRTGEVTEAIKAGGYGRVKLDGDDWKAQSDCAADLEIGTKVRIVGRESIIIKVVPEI